MAISPKRLNPTDTLEREMSDAIIRSCIVVVASDTFPSDHVIVA